LWTAGQLHSEELSAKRVVEGRCQTLKRCPCYEGWARKIVPSTTSDLASCLPTMFGCWSARPQSHLLLMSGI